MAIFIKRVTRAAITAAVGLALPFALGASPHRSAAEKVEGMEMSVDALEDKVLSTLMSGGSSPISFAGDARLKVQYHNLGFGAPGFMQSDRSHMQSGWEGGENFVRLGMVARPGRNTVLWSRIGFHHTMTGSYRYIPGDDGFSPYQYRHDKSRNSVSISEDLNAGIAVRTTPAAFWVRMGNTLWTEASPFTVWKAQPRHFAWEYLPFEIEQPISRYYEYNIATGERLGRAAWNKRPFNGINVESINLPASLYANFVYGTFERYDNFEREFVDFGGDLGYADGGSALESPSKSHGIGDSYRHVVHGRLAKSNMFGDLTLGLNYVGITYKDDVLYAFKSNPNTYHLLTEFGGSDSIFYKEPKVYSVDIRGPVNEKFSIHADVALSVIDTTWWVDTTARPGTATAVIDGRVGRPDWYTEKGSSSSDFVPAVYTRLNYHGFLPIQADLAYIGKGFYSPFSFATPVDGFFAYGANLMGAGKFIARGEGSPYTQNMAGVNLTLAPRVLGYGHLRLKYGQHFNIEEGRDQLFFPYRLHGYDMYSFFQSSYNRWGNSLIDNSVKSGRRYFGRLGDESFAIATSASTLGTHNDFVAGPGAGGLRSDYLGMFESFVSYNSAEEAYSNFMVKRQAAGVRAGQTSVRNQSFDQFYIYNPSTGRVDDTVRTSLTNTSYVPESKKYTFNLELEAAYDIGPFVNYKNDLLIGTYFGINGVSSSVKPVSFTDDAKDMLLWSKYLRVEPAVALSKSFYILGLFGYENWRSQRSWMMVSRDADDGSITGFLNPLAVDPADPYDPEKGFVYNPITADNFVLVPIDHRSLALGIGFDWDMVARVGLHGRVKWMNFEDRGLNDFYRKHKTTIAAADEGRDREESRYTDGSGNIKSSFKNDWSTPVISLEVKAFF
ncbi:MAG: hypothetical protein FWE57_02760 [Chitinispirillia bacterium]|nr:hypothetical protein [Chitinispirillia bacterium]